MLRAALVGRPNSGKSALFNRITGADAHVANFPGVTVDVLEASATLPSGDGVELLDLPGLYSLDPTLAIGTDEAIARDFLAGQRGRADGLIVVQILDATNLALALRLTLELALHEGSSPRCAVVTQADALAKEGKRVDVAALERALGVPVVVTFAHDPKAKELVLALIERARAAPVVEGPPPVWTPESVAESVLVTTLTGDEKRRSLRERTERIDRVLLHRFFGPPLFLLIMGAMFAAVFLIADPATTVCDLFVQWLAKGLRPLLGNGLLASLVVDGALGGVGTVFAFLPQIILLIVFMELLEGSGYLARAAFLVDRLFRIVGLGGKAFMPLLTAHACAVPAIAATRVLRDPRERLTTILVIPLMTCSARLPVYTLVVSAFFGGGVLQKALVCTTLYVAGIAAGLLAAIILRRTITKGRGLPLVLEMPTYRAPIWRSVGRRAWLEAADFVKRTGTVILVASCVLWALLSIPASGEGASDQPAIERSVAASIGRSLEPVTRPLGFDWRINVGLIGSFGARELMVGTLGVIFGVEHADQEPAPLVDKIRAAKRPDGTRAYTTGTAVALLVFFVFACQCMSTLSAIRRETRGWRIPAFVLAYTYVVAWVLAACAFQVVNLLT